MKADAPPRKKLTLRESFDLHTHMIPDCDCWLWGGPLTRGDYGYGFIPFEKKHVLAHRFSYAIHNGPLIDGLVIMHSCDNTWCVNPGHLSQNTQSANHADMVAKRRHRNMNTGRTDCIRGHSLSGANLMIAGGKRRCRTCHNACVAKSKRAARGRR